MKKITENNWCVKGNGDIEVRDYLRRTFDNNYMFNHVWYYFPKKDQNSLDYSTSIPPGFIELTIDEFKSQIMEKNIIGYICPEPLFGGEIKQGEKYIVYKINSELYIPEDYNHTNMSSYYSLPKEIVDKWEKIYKEDLCVSISAGSPTQFIKIFKDKEIRFENKVFPKDVILQIVNDIKQPTPIINLIDKFDISYIIDDYSIRIGCTTFSKNEIEEILKYL
jgi:hypothetical protein